MIDASVTVRRSAGCTYRWFRGGVLILAGNGARARVSGSGALVWMALDAAATPTEIAHRITRIWPGMGSADVSSVVGAIETLQSHGLVAVDAGLVTSRA